MGMVNLKRMAHIAKHYRSRFTTVVGIRPTGWTHSAGRIPDFHPQFCSILKEGACGEMKHYEGQTVDTLCPIAAAPRPRASVWHYLQGWIEAMYLLDKNIATNRPIRSKPEFSSKTTSLPVAMIPASGRLVESELLHDGRGITAAVRKALRAICVECREEPRVPRQAAAEGQPHSVQRALLRALQLQGAAGICALAAARQNYPHGGQ